MFDDNFARRWADAECGLRVTASISKGAFLATRLLMTEPPCFPVAPVISTAFTIAVFGVWISDMWKRYGSNVAGDADICLIRQGHFTDFI